MAETGQPAPGDIAATLKGREPSGVGDAVVVIDCEPLQAVR